MKQEFAFNVGYIKSEFESVNVVNGECQGIICRFQGDMEKAVCICRERIMLNYMSC